MTDAEIIAQLRRILEQEVVRDLRMLAARTGELSSQIEASHRAIEEKMEAVYIEQIALHVELKAMREDESGTSAPPLLVH